MKRFFVVSEDEADMSPLAWGRGLKHQRLDDKFAQGWSPLAWGRGLKQAERTTDTRLHVAPRVGAWIETVCVIAGAPVVSSRPSRGGVD